MKEPESRYCHKHEVQVDPIYSKKKKKWYWVHTAPDLTDCWVNSEEEDDGFREKQVDYGRDNKF